MSSSEMVESDSWNFMNVYLRQGMSVYILGPREKDFLGKAMGIFYLSPPLLIFSTQISKPMARLLCVDMNIEIQ
ncbi:hypothetical protein J437_LFUL006418 [Ladona fulva]|uniref:Uncharacterized protein n=1 Tax=Ladona fulva TaxID=123851 RepID=A0A8K0K3R6_LADFU|nr:hypothetical protein J437_LFUL006418 [Ladona fulva]